MHLRFADELSAQRALSRHGKLVVGNLMVGAVPTSQTQHSIPSSSTQDDLAGSLHRQRRPKGITAASIIAAPQAGAAATAGASESWLSKVTDYILGW